MRLEPKISDLNSGLFNYALHPKPLWFGFLITGLRCNRISQLKEPSRTWAFTKNSFPPIQGLAGRDKRWKVKCSRKERGGVEVVLQNIEAASSSHTIETRA